MYMCARVSMLPISTIFLLNFCNCAESVVNCESHHGGNWNCLTNLQTYHYSMIFMLVYKFYIWPEGKFFKIYSTLYLYHDAISPLICWIAHPANTTRYEFVIKILTYHCGFPVFRLLTDFVWLLIYEFFYFPFRRLLCVR